MSDTTHLVLETKAQQDKTPEIAGFLGTPPIDEGYWLFRVKVSDTQAVLGFPKFGVVGIGFAVEEESWNTNLPSRCDAEEIYEHIEPNKGDDSITREDCVAAIQMVKDAAAGERTATDA